MVECTTSSIIIGNGCDSRDEDRLPGAILNGEHSSTDAPGRESRCEGGGEGMTLRDGSKIMVLFQHDQIHHHLTSSEKQNLNSSENNTNE